MKVPTIAELEQAKQYLDFASSLVPVALLREWLDAKDVAEAEAAFEAAKNAKFGTEVKP